MFQESSGSCSTPTTELSLGNDADDNESEDDSLDPSTASSPTDLTKDGSDQLTARSTSEPLRNPSTSTLGY